MTRTISGRTLPMGAHYASTRPSARLDFLEGPFKLYRCRTIMNCTEVCPKGLAPSHLIEKLGWRMPQHSFQEVLPDLTPIVRMSKVCLRADLSPSLRARNKYG